MTRAPASLCPADPAHGPVLLIGDIYWCPVQSHDSERIRPVLQDAARSFDAEEASMGNEPGRSLGAAPIDGRDRHPGVGTPSKVRRSTAGLTPG